MFSKILNAALSGALGAALSIGVSNSYDKLRLVSVVESAKWEWAKNSFDRFLTKHTLNGLANIQSQSVARKWDRNAWNDQIRKMLTDPIYLANANKHYPEPVSAAYGDIRRLSIILYEGGYVQHKVIQLKKEESYALWTGLRNRPDPDNPNSYTYQNQSMIFYPEKLPIAYAIWQDLKKSYDVYIMDDVFVIVGTQPVSQDDKRRMPTHYEGHFMPRENETDANKLQKTNSLPTLQARWRRSQIMDSYFKHATCIAFY